MNKPPKTIDNAEVLYWAWSGEMPFGTVEDSNGENATEIFGLAICKYDKSNSIYRFSCDQNWETEQDSDYSAVNEAMRDLPNQYNDVQAIWFKYE